ncbi:hypothetical protein GOP47_0025790 [Adiantum capillus-veneris]|uniref:Uncharacterized protein n=1 Tax=Adiantum capillus-veneris TaxID=13818 RepID=A0A9D4Z4G4_ADICA|nr:hypothetical protein GOP47_0025790 [Adiantum capillus-veneris]
MDKETPNAHRGAHTRVARAAPDDESQEIAAKYRGYEKEYLRRINHKYFSGATLSGDQVFESSVTVDGFGFKESKIAPLKKFVEGPSICEEHGRGSVADTAPGLSKKNGAKKS